MPKKAVVNKLTILLNRGVQKAESTNYFLDKKHEDLLNEFVEYLESHKELFGNSQLEITQALNDRGTDVILELDGCKIGFQIKSHFDVAERSFASNVKRQITESLAHKLDKWFLLICASLKDSKNSYEQRISHLLNEISSYDNPYIGAYSPRNTIAYFDSPKKLTAVEFSLEEQRRGYGEDAIAQILDLLRGSKLGGEINKPQEIIDPENDTTMISKNPENLAYLVDILSWGEAPNDDIQPTIDDFNKLLDQLRPIPIRERQLLAVIVSILSDESGGNIILWPELRGRSGLSDQQLRESMSIFKKRNIADTYFDEEKGVDVIYFIDHRYDWPIWLTIKEFSDESGISLRKLLVDLDFSVMDHEE